MFRTMVTLVIGYLGGSYVLSQPWAFIFIVCFALAFGMSIAKLITDSIDKLDEKGM